MALVFMAAVIFVNAIEYLGCRFHLGGSFVGAILAPLFTSFPELTVFLVAVFAHGGEVREEIGIGTLFGQPFMASSLSYGLVGIAALIGYLAKRRNNAVLTVDKTLAIPYIFYYSPFPLNSCAFISGYEPCKTYIWGHISRRFRNLYMANVSQKEDRTYRGCRRSLSV